MLVVMSKMYSHGSESKKSTLHAHQPPASKDAAHGKDRRKHAKQWGIHSLLVRLVPEETRSMFIMGPNIES